MVSVVRMVCMVGEMMATKRCVEIQRGVKWHCMRHYMWLMMWNMMWWSMVAVSIAVVIIEDENVYGLGSGGCRFLGHARCRLLREQGQRGYQIESYDTSHD